MGNIKSRDIHDHPSATTTDDNECPPLGYPTTSYRTMDRDPFLSLLEGFSHVYLQGKEVIERLFPGACDELLDFLDRVALRGLVPKMENQVCTRSLQRSASMGSFSDNERFKVRDFDVDGVAQPAQPDGDQKPDNHPK